MTNGCSTTVAFLFNPDNPNAELDLPDLQVAGRAMGMQIKVLPARTPRDIQAVFASLVPQPPSALTSLH